MPHLHLEFSAPLEKEADIQGLCDTLRDTLVETGLFPLAGTRVRAYPAGTFTVADGDPQNAFLAMVLSVGAGRTQAQLHVAGQAVFDAARGFFPDRLAEPYFSLSLEIREMDPVLAWKETPIHARLKNPA